MTVLLLPGRASDRDRVVKPCQEGPPLQRADKDAADFIAGLSDRKHWSFVVLGHVSSLPPRFSFLSSSRFFFVLIEPRTLCLPGQSSSQIPAPCLGSTVYVPWLYRVAHWFLCFNKSNLVSWIRSHEQCISSSPQTLICVSNIIQIPLLKTKLKPNHSLHL